MNYKILTDTGIFNQFVNTLPELTNNEKWYVTLLARNKYVKSLPKDKIALKRFTSDTKLLYRKIKQLEVEIGAYTVDDTSIPNEALALYISVNPRCMIKAAKNSLIKFAHLVTQEYNGYNPHSEVLSEIQKAKSRTVFMDFDFDNIDFKSEILHDIVNLDAVRVLKTRGGFHLLVEVDKVSDQYKKLWYQKITKLPNVDVRGDNLIPVPGTTQGGFTPYFMIA